MEKNIDQYDMNKIRRKIFSMILPITIEGMLQMTTGMVSMAMMGRIDEVAIGALGLSMRITNIVWALFRGVTTGAAVFVAQAYGAENKEKIRHIIIQTLLSSLVLVGIFQQIIFWKANVLLGIFNPDSELMAQSILYLKTVSWGLPFFAIMLVVAGVLQAMGNAKTPMKIAFLMNFLNIAFGWVLIFGKLGMPALGIKGAAIGLIIAQLTAAIIGIYILFNKKGILDFSSYGKLKPDTKEIKSIYRVGLPSSMEAIFWQIASIILTRTVLSYGKVALAAYQLGLQAESISYTPAMGFGVAATAFIGQAVGARDKKIGKIYLKEIIKGTVIFTSVSTLVLVFLPKQFLRILTDQREVIELGAIYLIFMGLVQIPQNISGVLNGALRGGGYTRVPMIVAGAGLWGIRIPMALICAYWLKLDIIYIWAAICIDLIFRFILSFILYKTKDIYDGKIVLE